MIKTINIQTVFRTLRRLEFSCEKNRQLPEGQVKYLQAGEKHAR